MICVPSLTLSTDNPNGGLSHRDVIQELCTLLASFRGGNPAVISILREKLSMSDFQYLLMSPPDSGRFVDYQPFDPGDLNESNGSGDVDEESRPYETAEELARGTKVPEDIESVDEEFEVF
jgi:hypothetical protein